MNRPNFVLCRILRHRLLQRLEEETCQKRMNAMEEEEEEEEEEGGHEQEAAAVQMQ